MTDIHVKTLARYDKLGSIYSYGYGAMRQAYQSFHDGLDTLDQYINQVQHIISAVEFRSAELLAEHMIATDISLQAADRTGRVRALAPPSAIYEAPQAADGIARDQ